MAEVERAEVDAVVSSAGDLVIPRDAVRQLALVPGQHVTVSVQTRRPRRNMYGALAGRLPDVDPDDLARVRREAWGDLAAGP